MSTRAVDESLFHGMKQEIKAYEALTKVTMYDGLHGLEEKLRKYEKSIARTILFLMTEDFDVKQHLIKTSGRLSMDPRVMMATDIPYDVWSDGTTPLDISSKELNRDEVLSEVVELETRLRDYQEKVANGPTINENTFKE